MLLASAILALGLTYFWVYIVATHGPRLFGPGVLWFERAGSLGEKVVVAAKSCALTLALAFVVAVAASWIAPSQVPTTRVLVKPDSPASRGGMQNGDVITAVGGQRVESFDQVQAVLRSGQSPLGLEVQRGSETLRLEVTPANGRLGVRVAAEDRQRTLPEAVQFASETLKSNAAASLSPVPASQAVAGPVSLLREASRGGRGASVLLLVVILQAGFLLLVPLIHGFDVLTQLLGRGISGAAPVRRDAFHLYVLGTLMLMFTAWGVLQEWRSATTSTSPLLDLLSQACGLSLTLASFTALKRHLSLRLAGTLAGIGAFVGPVLWIGTFLLAFRRREPVAAVSAG